MHSVITMCYSRVGPYSHRNYCTTTSIVRLCNTGGRKDSCTLSFPKCNVIETRKEEEDEKKGGHENGEGRENK